MGKSILIIETPEICGECQFSEHDGLVCAIQKCNMSREESEDKPKWCPLKEAPSKMTMDNQPFFDESYMAGWNSCVDYILKEED